MGYRTLIEFNHDVAGKSVDADPAAFVDLVLQLLASGENVRLTEKLKGFGVTTLRTRHSSIPCSVSYDGDREVIGL